MTQTVIDAPPAAPSPAAPPTWNVELVDADLPLGRGLTVRGVRIDARPETVPTPDVKAVDDLTAALARERQTFLATSPAVETVTRLRTAYHATLAEAEAARERAAKLQADADAAVVALTDPAPAEQAGREAAHQAEQLTARAERLAGLLEDAQRQAQQALAAHLAAVHTEHAELARMEHDEAVAELRAAVARIIPRAAAAASTRIALDRVDPDKTLPDAIDFHARRLDVARADLRRGLSEFRKLPFALRKVARAAVGTARAGVPAVGDEAAVLAGIPSLVRLIRGPVPVRDVLRAFTVADLAGRDEDLANVLVDLRR